LIAGFQDNGTQIYTGSQGWPVGGGTEMAGGGSETGDGGFASFDQIDPNVLYHTFASGTDTCTSCPFLSLSTNGGLHWDTSPTTAIEAALKAAKDGGAAFYPPLVPDPAIPYRVLVGAQGVRQPTECQVGVSKQARY
jgi:hypothetical protein